MIKAWFEPGHLELACLLVGRVGQERHVVLGVTAFLDFLQLLAKLVLRSGLLVEV
jgi:hypothetical protein